MNELFLRAVELSNFRVYGDSYAFELVDGPGITLITGANGLGKTSFFDGVEWALTGQVSRFSDIRVDGRRRGADPLTRIGAGIGSHRVSLAFNVGSPIDRGNGFVPDERAIAELLKMATWPEISQLHGYLSVTHFLGQASTRRFSVREPKAQWEALKGPAGVDRINALRERVSGLGARRAFTRAIRDRVQAVQKAEEVLVSWRSLIAERDRLSRLSSSDRAVTPSQVRERVEDLARQLLALAPGTAWKPIDAGDEAEATLNRLRLLLDALSRQGADEKARCRDLDRILAEFNNAGSRATATIALAQEISDRRGKLIEAMAEAEARLSQASSAHSLSQQAAAQIQARAGALARVTRGVEQLDQCHAELAEIDQQLEAARVAGDQASAQLRDVHEKLELVQALRAERSSLTRRQRQAQQRARISSALALVRAEAERLSALVAGVDAALLCADRSALNDELSHTSAEVGRIEDELRRHDDRARTVAEAVALIAHHLNHDDHSCPVCATTFEPGRLKELALTQAQRTLTPATDLASELIVVKGRREDLAQQIAQLDRQIIEHDQIMARLASEQARETDLVGQMVEAEGLPGSTYNDTEVLALESLLKEADVELAAQPTEDALAELTLEAQTRLDANRVRRTSLERRRAGVASDIESTRLMLGQHADLWTPETGLVVALNDAHRLVEHDARAIGDRLGMEATAVDEARIARDSLLEGIVREDANLANATRSVETLAEDRRRLVQEWTASGQSGEPDITWITQLRTRTAERDHWLTPITEAHAELINGLRRWREDQQLQERENALRAEMEQRGSSSVEEMIALLEREVHAAQLALEKAQRAHSTMESIGVRMQDRADRFADDVLKPLNDTIQRFARPLMTWTDASIIYRAEHYATRSELRPAIVRSTTGGSTTQLEMNPNLYFSEGQLSALSVSALLAASTTFNWSKWRGLLLDDPLQHNDVIHASAFMDLLRQMVRELGYQVVLSTHDSAEAEFLLRKCRSAGIPYAVHELVPQGENGLVSAAA